MKNYDLYKIHFSAFLFGFAGLFGKWIQIDALMIVWGRVLFASMAFGFLFGVQKRNPFLISIRTYTIYILFGALLAFHWWSFFLAIQISNVAIGLFSFSTFPVFTVLLEPFFFKEKWRVHYLFLALLSLTGIYIMLPNLDWSQRFSYGVLWGVGSGFSFALLTIFNRLLLVAVNIPKSSKSNLHMANSNAVNIAFFQDFFALIWLSPFVVFQLDRISMINWGQLALLGVVFTALAHVLFISGLKKTNARIASLIANMEPIYGVLFAWILLNESMNMSLALGGSLIVFAAILAAYLQKKQN